MSCTRCGSWCAPSDNYCRRCGDRLQMVLPPAPQRSLAVLSSLAAIPAALPPALVKGVAVMALGKAAEWAMRRAAGKLAGGAADVARSLLPEARPKSTRPAKAADGAAAAGDVIAEVVVMWRQIRRIGDSPAPPRR